MSLMGARPDEVHAWVPLPWVQKRGCLGARRPTGRRCVRPTLRCAAKRFASPRQREREASGFPCPVWPFPGQPDKVTISTRTAGLDNGAEVARNENDALGQGSDVCSQRRRRAGASAFGGRDRRTAGRTVQPFIADAAATHSLRAVGVDTGFVGSAVRVGGTARCERSRNGLVAECVDAPRAVGTIRISGAA